MKPQTKDIDGTKIKTLNQRDHAIVRKAMYIGGEETQKNTVLVFNKRTNQFDTKLCSYQEQTQKLFDEIFQNALDNYIRHKTNDYFINIDLKPREFTIENNGSVFKIDTQEQQDSIIRIFSKFNTSSQYQETENEGSGRNGLGAKLVNILSKTFEITNTQKGQSFYIRFEKGELVKKELRRDLKKDLGKVKSQGSFKVHVELLDKGEIIGREIQCVQNFDDFNMDMILQYLVVVQCIYPFIKINLNGEAIKQFDFENLLKAFQIEKYFIFMPLKSLQVAVYKKEKTLFTRYSLINGNQTFDTIGTHYNKLQQKMKNTFKIKETLSCGMIFLGNVGSIDYSDQVKTKISKFPDLKLPPGLGDFIRDVLCEKKAKKNYSQLFDSKLIEANQRGPNATLIITEGDSAATLFRAIGAKIDGFFNMYGIFPLRGKVQNVVKDDNFDDKSELNKLMEIIGAQPGIDYNVEQNRRTLRYGHVLIASDYDVDGFHIKGLLINFIYHFWPALLDKDFLQEFITPIIMADGKEFYSEADFVEYRQNNQVKQVKYYKGLGTFQEKDQERIGRSFSKYIKKIVWSDKDLEQKYIELLFEKESKNRKKLIEMYQPIVGKNRAQPEIDVHYLMSQVTEYAVASLDRAIPDFIDGLKDVQRKIVYYFMCHRVEQDGVKVSTLQGRVSSSYDYHHGDSSMEGAIIKMAQNFAGTNNCNLLEPLGAFGVRFNPRSAASRYIYTKGSKWIKTLFDENEKLIYEYNLSDDGQMIEPKRLFPLVPLALVNGAEGISTGWSSSIPSYRLKDIVSCVIEYLQFGKVKQILPYYEGYVGRIYQDENNRIMCEGKQYWDEDAQTLKIYDTHIQTNQTALKEYLDKNKIQYDMQKNYILIKGATVDIATAITKKFQLCVISLSNITLLHYRDKQIKQYDNVQEYIKDWCKYRLEYQEKKRDEIQKHILREYVKLWFLHKFIEPGYIEKEPCVSFLRNKPKMEKLLLMFPSDKEIDTLNETELTEIKEWLKQWPRQSESTTSRTYITSKTIGFFQKELPPLEEKEDEYKCVHNKSAKQAWIQQLQNLQTLDRK